MDQGRAGDGLAALHKHEGFELGDAPSTVVDSTDEDAIRNRYYAEAAELGLITIQWCLLD
jgi:hypothetical protein